MKHPAENGRCDFPDPKGSSSAPPHRVIGEIVGHCARWDEKIIVGRAGVKNGGFTVYPHGELREMAAVSVQPGQLLLDPTVKKKITAEMPYVIREGIEDGCFRELDGGGDNYGGSYRVVAPLGPVLTPEQIDAVAASIEAARQVRPYRS